MNSYPPELLAQLAPVMFAAGLDPPAAPPPISPTTTNAPAPPSKPLDPFQTLTLRLRDALLNQRKPAIWNPEKAKSFQVILVEKDVRFPPRKLVPPEDPQYSSAHSPLSPMTPTSPLHPDGLIAPIWIRKHTTLVPSVFVLFLRIFEFPAQQAGRPPLDVPDVEKEQEERKHDSELAAEVALRKKATNERGIKLTVVLMATRRMLDDPALDARLTFIRRQSGLDSRAALFVLSPVSQAELGDFVRSLQQALYESALEYYTAHSKRVRRKRNRHSSQAYPVVPPSGTSVQIARPLRPEGWTVRYEYKMACFAEFRGEDEVALKHYQDAYGMLVIMFGSTAILPPRTKRWAEAKVLADCINLKIVKLYLYNNEHALALSHHNTHMRKFGDFSRGWGIGEETFEFWSWIARQHRILAELLEQGTRSTLVIPSHKPAPLPAITATPPVNLAATTLLPSSLGINPSHALQHPGFYYYAAARCTELRRERFTAALEAELRQHPTALSPGFTNEKKVEHLGIILELYTKAYELFKKYSPTAMSQNQQQAQTQGRLTLWIAYCIAQTYYDSGKFDMAVRFFERIAKTYRREKWHSMLRPLLSTWYACAQQLGDVELSIKLLIEMLGHDAPEGDEPSALEEDLVAVFKSTVPSSTDEPLVVDLSESQPIFDSNVVFWMPEVMVGEAAAFQLSLTAPSRNTISSIPFASLAIHFSNSDNPIIMRHTPLDGHENRMVQRVDLGHVNIGKVEDDDEDGDGNGGEDEEGEGEGEEEGKEPREVTVDLRWRPGSTTVFSGTMSSETPSAMKITKLVLTIIENKWVVEIPFPPCGSRQGSTLPGRWLSVLDPPRFIPIKREEYSYAIVKHRLHNLSVKLKHRAPAYLDEDYPIIIEVSNTDTRELDVVVDVLLQPTEVDAINSIRIGEERSAGLIKGVHLGTIASGSSTQRTLHLINTGAGGDRMIDISVQSRTIVLGHVMTPAEDENEDKGAVEDMMEHLQALVVPTVDPFVITHDVVYRRASKEWSGLSDLDTFQEDFWDDRRGGEALVNFKLECVGPWNIELESVTLERQDTNTAKIIDSSTDAEDDMHPSEFLPGDQLGGFCRVSLAPPDDEEPLQEPGPGRYFIKWRRILEDGKRGVLATSIVQLPSLRPPTDDLVALISVPPVATLHVPTTLELTIRNYNLSRSANVSVQLEVDTFDSFVVAGLRSGRVPVLLPGTEEKLTWNLVPIECGYVRIPRVKVFDRRKAISGTEDAGAGPESIGETVKVVDIRRDTRRVSGTAGTETDAVDFQEGQGTPGTILVLP